jgi:hypothetical protein
MDNSGQGFRCRLISNGAQPCHVIICLSLDVSISHVMAVPGLDPGIGPGHPDP